MTVRIGFVGAGRVAQHYKKILLSGSVQNFSIVGICDLNILAAQELAKSFSCDVFSSLSQMIEKVKPDLICILTPSGLHYEQAHKALLSGVNLLVEKPLSMATDQVKELCRLAKQKDLLLSVGFQNRLNPAMLCLRKAVDENRFGKIVTATIRLRWCRYQSYYDDEWHGTWEQDGGVINQQAIHHVDALSWLIGPADSVCARMDNQLNNLEAEDTLVGLIKFQNGTLSTVEATTAARPHDVEASISIVGEKGIAVVGGIGLNKIETWDFVIPEEKDSTIPIENSIDVPTGYGLSHGPLLQGIITALENGSTKSPVDAVDTLRTTELIQAFYASVEQGAWVKMSDNPSSKKLGVKSDGN